MDYEKIKIKAQEFLNTYNPTGLVPFPYSETIATLGDIKLAYLDTTNPEISGAIYFQDDKYAIVINSTKPATRQYFTVAHELGHYYLHKQWLLDNPSSGIIDYGFLDGVAALLRPDSPPTDEATILMEKEANNFAAEILMPEDKVKEYWNLTHDIVRCADAFHVSKSAMAIRLEKLRIL